MSERLDGSVNLGRHRRNCKICAHQHREEIEREFINWTGVKAIAKEFGLADRTAVYRHAHAFGLFSKRQRNIRAALEKIIEKAVEVEVTSAAVVAAVQAYARLNAQGQWIDRVEHVNLNELFERMSEAEMEAHAREGILPTWFKGALSATPLNSQDAENDD
jgi:Glu-tRNA(Gln) amidotransferase subunit E-like FAD-binding protein